MKRIIALLLAVCLGAGLCLPAAAAEPAQPSLPAIYGQQRIPALVLEGAEAAQASPASTALVRQPGGKIAFMARNDSGAMEPFYPLAMETGYWDSRLTLNNPPPTTQNSGVVSHLWDTPRTGWDDVFGDIASTGANTVQVTIHWANWEPEKDKYDFFFCDSIVEAASRHGLKTIFVVFFHYQMNFISPEYDDLWMYHLDDRQEGGKLRNYAIQWGGYDSIADARAMYNPAGFGDACRHPDPNSGGFCCPGCRPERRGTRAVRFCRGGLAAAPVCHPPLRCNTRHITYKKILHFSKKDRGVQRASVFAYGGRGGKKPGAGCIP